MRYGLVAAVAFAVVACVQYPPMPPVTAEPIPIDASFDQVWNAVIEHFAANVIPIRTIEKASGLIVSDIMRLPYADRDALRTYADCGTDPMGTYGVPGRYQYNVRVVGDSTKATARVTAIFESATAATPVCNTRGKLERLLVDAIKRAAEQRPD